MGRTAVSSPATRRASSPPSNSSPTEGWRRPAELLPAAHCPGTSPSAPMQDCSSVRNDRHRVVESPAVINASAAAHGTARLCRQPLSCRAELGRRGPARVGRVLPVDETRLPVVTSPGQRTQVHSRGRSDGGRSTTVRTCRARRAEQRRPSPRLPSGGLQLWAHRELPCPSDCLRARMRCPKGSRQGPHQRGHGEHHNLSVWRKIQ